MTFRDTFHSAGHIDSHIFRCCSYRHRRFCLWEMSPYTRSVTEAEDAWKKRESLLTFLISHFHFSLIIPHSTFERSDIQVVIAAGSHLFPFRTEKLSPPAPMVLQCNAGE